MFMVPLCWVPSASSKGGVWMLKLVIADGDARMRSQLHTLVDWNAFGFEPVGIASNGAEALELVQSCQPNLLITDIHMPDCNGLELIKQAKTIAPQLEAIIISADACFEYAQSAIRLDVCDYLLKPVSQQQLTQALERLIERFRSRQRLGSVAARLSQEGGEPSLRSQASKATDARIIQQQNASPRPIRLAKQYVFEHYQEPITLEKVCEVIGFSVSYFSSIFKKETGENFIRFLTRTRIERAKELLVQTNLPISEICTSVGYSDLKYFTQTFKRETDLTPGQYRKHHS